MGFKRMLLLSAHGPEFPEYASYAARKVSKRTGMKVLCVRAYDLLKRSEIEEMTGEPYIHGAPCETSLMLLFRPELVSLEEVREGAMNGLLSSRPSFTPKEGGSFTLGILGKQALKWERGCASSL
jgi:creatinine amidohydrolase/Fe(II)-dependent formamide hydrolase-like protein